MLRNKRGREKKKTPLVMVVHACKQPNEQMYRRANIYPPKHTTFGVLHTPDDDRTSEKKKYQLVVFLVDVATTATSDWRPE